LAVRWCWAACWRSRCATWPRRGRAFRQKRSRNDKAAIFRIAALLGTYRASINRPAASSGPARSGAGSSGTGPAGR
jgi:hypothetical protein